MAPTAVITRKSDDRRSSDIWQAITALVLDGIASQNTRRAYSQALEEFLIWFRDEPGREFNKAAVQKYRTELQMKGLAPASINVRLSAIRRLAYEAADNGLIAPELAASIARAKGAKRAGVRLGHWLTAAQAEQLLAAPDRGTLKGLRDAAVLSLLLGAGLRRSEVARLTLEQIQLREGRWLIVDLIGKHGRMRSVPIPSWAYSSITEWSRAAARNVGPIFRRVTRHGRVAAQQISPQAVFEIVRNHAKTIGISVAPHDLRRTFAKLAHLGEAPLEQIQLSLGHASVITTEIYLGVKQNLADPCDRLGLKPQVTDPQINGPEPCY